MSFFTCSFQTRIQKTPAFFRSLSSFIVCRFQWFLVQRSPANGLQMYRKSIFFQFGCAFTICQIIRGCCSCCSFLFVYFSTISVEFLCNKNGGLLLWHRQWVFERTHFNKPWRDFSLRLSDSTNSTVRCVLGTRTSSTSFTEKGNKVNIFTRLSRCDFNWVPVFVTNLNVNEMSKSNGNQTEPNWYKVHFLFPEKIYKHCSNCKRAFSSLR